MWNEVFDLKKIHWDGSIRGEDCSLLKMGKLAFTKVSAILCVRKGALIRNKTLKIIPRKPQRVFGLPEQNFSAMKVLMQVIRTGIGMAVFRPLYGFYRLFLYESLVVTSILRQVENTVKILSLALYCTRAVRNFCL